MPARPLPVRPQLPERLRILLADDSPDDRRAAAEAIRRGAAADGMDAEVREAETAAEVRDALRQEEFTCVFLDHDLPGGTALDLMLEIRTLGLATPVVVLTGQRDEQVILEVMRAGAADYLPKERLQEERLQPDLVARSLRAALRFQTVQREKQSVLEELRARDRAIAAATNGIVLADPRQPDCPLVYVNQAFLEMTGYTEAEVIGRNCRFLQGLATNPDTVRELRDAIGIASPSQVAILNHRKDGTPFWNELTISPVWDEAGTLTHFVGIQTDVTPRIEQDQARTRTENRLRQFQYLSDNANDGLFLLDDLGRFLYVNAAACRSLGYTVEEILRMRTVDIDPNYDEAAYAALFERAANERIPPFESVQRRADGTLFPVEASVSRFDAGGRPMLFSSTRDISERKMLEEERAQIARREHQIAEQLQSALQPELPGVVPGLTVTKYYEPALVEEAEVGGDFYDVFAVEKGRTALVLGDLSGKGLQAAAQVSIVRNMLRAFLYSKPTVAEAVTELNRVLAENNLLTGFSTLFAGVFDAAARTLNYVNCGQEPALLKRAATGGIERLTPTGPILGSIENARYAEEAVTLRPGDTLAVFSDGLTEIGPTRRALLGIDGLSALLAESPETDRQNELQTNELQTNELQTNELQTAAERAESLALHLIAGVNAAASGGSMRDDICLLVCIAEE